MTAARFYSSTAAATTLTGGINGSVTSITVGSVTGFPVTFPYTLILDEGETSEEVVQVSGSSGLDLTVSRGVDGTTGVSHSSGAVVIHGVSARDFREPQEHIGASAGVHGATGAVVGTTDVQTLTNKTLTSPVINTAWSTYTPVVKADASTASASVANGRYKVRDGVCDWWATVIISSGATGKVTISLPQASVAFSGSSWINVGHVAYQRAGITWGSSLLSNANSTANLYRDDAVAESGGGFTITVSSGDVLYASGSYPVN